MLQITALPLLMAVLLVFSGCQTDPEQKSLMLALSKDQIKQLSPEKESHYMAVYRDNLRTKQYTLSTSSMPRSKNISVSLRDGTALMRPDYKPETFTPTEVSIAANRCEEVRLFSHQHPKKYALVSLCYLHNSLYVDASSTDALYPSGSVIIPIHEYIDNTQQFCQLETKGNAHLRNTCLTLVQPHTQSTLPADRLTKANKNKKFTPQLREDSEIDPFTEYQ